jgi:uncharacterized FlgJ-related protein
VTLLEFFFSSNSERFFFTISFLFLQHIIYISRRWAKFSQEFYFFTRSFFPRLDHYNNSPVGPKHLELETYLSVLETKETFYPKLNKIPQKFANCFSTAEVRHFLITNIYKVTKFCSKNKTKVKKILTTKYVPLAQKYLELELKHMKS